MRVHHQARNSCFSPVNKETGARFDAIELQEFTKVLREIVFIEREVESAKIELALKTDFNLYDLFKMIDVRGVGELNQKDLEMALT